MPKLIAHRGIVVGVDGSPGSNAAVQWAARDAELRTLPLTLVHVLAVTARTHARRQRGQQLLDEALKLATESCCRGPTEIYCEMPCGRTVPTLVEISKVADLMVVGCFGRTGTVRPHGISQ